MLAVLVVVLLRKDWWAGGRSRRERRSSSKEEDGEEREKWKKELERSRAEKLTRIVHGYDLLLRRLIVHLALRCDSQQLLARAEMQTSSAFRGESQCLCLAAHVRTLARLRVHCKDEDGCGGGGIGWVSFRVTPY